MNIPYSGSKGPLHLLIDSTGIKIEGEGEWYARKYGGLGCRVWCKIHRGIDEETLEVRAVEITGNHIGDGRCYLTCSKRTRSRTRSAALPQTTLTTRANAIFDRGADAVILARKNAKPSKIVSAGARGTKRGSAGIEYLGHALWRRSSGYQRRGRVEL